MPASCNKRNPLTRSGTNQAGRFLPSLDPGFFQVDERQVADLVLFAQRLSRHIQYFNAKNQEEGDWFAFFSSDITSILASLIKLPVALFQGVSRALQQYLVSDPLRGGRDLSSHFKLLFHLPMVLLEELNRHYSRLPQDHTLKTFIENVIVRDAESALRDVIRYYKGAVTLDDPPHGIPIFDDAPLNPDDYAASDVTLPSEVSGLAFTGRPLAELVVSDPLVQAFAPNGWSDFYDSVPPDTSPYLDSIASGSSQSYQQIYDALNYNLLSGAFDRLYQAFERISAEAAKFLQETLTHDDRHTPHFGLWLAFLQLFRFNQEHLNSLTGRHLDYYYKQILQLRHRGAEPDGVHLSFELNKNVDQHLLPAGTEFKAGKDDLGIEVSYQLDYDFVANRAQLQSLKSIFRPAGLLDGSKVFRPYAAPVTDSADGRGEPLPKDDPQFKPFGPWDSSLDLPNARIGFAVADRLLFLREGMRHIEIIVQAEIGQSIVSLPPAFRALLTTDDGWLEIKGPPKLAASVLSDQSPTLELSFVLELNGEDPPIIPYDVEIHGDEFSVSAPMVKIEFDFAETPDDAAAAFTRFQGLSFGGLTLSVHVEGVRNLTLQNDLGVLDAAKPFQPFGSAPNVGASLVIGSSEVFSKRLSEVQLHVEWEQSLNDNSFFLKAEPNEYMVDFSHLTGGQWQLAHSNIGLFVSESGEPLSVSNLAAMRDSLAQTLENVPYSSTSTAGYLKLELKKDFGHQTYQTIYTAAVIELAQDTKTTTEYSDFNFMTTPHVPLQPYTPTIKEVTLSYATETIAPANFFHLHPFGQKEEAAAGARLFPAFPHEGELFIGIKDLDPPQRLSMLFQVVDGTANPLKGETKSRWYCLKGNDWILLEDQSIDDKTNSLTGSGIIGIAVPEDADTEHSLLPTGLHWLRMTVEKDTDALNSLLAVEMQAASATLVERGNDPAFLASPLPGGTISKLKAGDAAVKKVRQPYPSFGGKPPETDRHFYTRVSERLRHKGRGATMWDYEHLVLEHFPKIYRAKCINHTELCRDLDNNILADNEVRPGHVLVVPIPHLKRNNVVDPLRPYTDKKTIVAIDRFLRARISPFVQLEVQNPKIEEVQVKFRIAFNDEVVDIRFYKDELQRAITRFLTPWAYDDGVEISFGGKWHKSAIINFVEEQSFVNFVKDFEMYHLPAPAAGDGTTRRDVETVEATTSRSILVSHKQHLIEEII